jgi:hypothetical protein
VVDPADLTDASDIVAATRTLRGKITHRFDGTLAPRPPIVGATA